MQNRPSRLTTLPKTLTVILLGFAVTASAVAQGSAGCGGSSAPSDGNRTVSVSGYGNRNYRLDKPSGYNDNNPMPVMIAYHARGVGSPPFLSTWGQLFCSQYYGNFGAAVGSEGIIVCPEGVPSSGQPAGSQDWFDSSDLDFFDAMVADLKDDLCIDESRIFVAGHSAGAFQAADIGCLRGDEVRGIAAVSGGGPGSCTQVGQVAAIVLHTTPDPVVNPSASVGTRDYFAEENGCNLNSSSSVGSRNCKRSGEDDLHVTYSGCDDDVYPVEYCRWDDIGHQGMWSSWAGGADVAAPALWDFFMSLGSVVTTPTPIFDDDFEPDLTAWSSVTGGVTASSRSAHGGSRGAEIPIGSSCADPNTVVVGPGEADELVEACISVETNDGSDVVVEGSGAEFRAGYLVTLGNGFSVPDGIPFIASLNPSATQWAYVTDQSPDAVDHYRANFWTRLDALTIGAGDAIDHFVGRSSDGTVQFRVTLSYDSALDEERISVHGRNGDTTYTDSVEAIFPSDWTEVEVEWEAGSGSGFLTVSIDGSPSTSVTGLDNASATIDEVRWGAVSGIAAGNLGRIDIDDFQSWE